MAELIREPIKIDSGGRLTLPRKFREALNLSLTGKDVVMIEAYPDLEKCKSLIIKRYY